MNAKNVDSFALVQGAMTEIQAQRKVFLAPLEGKGSYALCDNCPESAGPDDPHRDVCPCLPRNGGNGMCHGFHAATDDVALVAMWATRHPESKLAVALGPVSENVIVIEWDPKNGGEKSWEGLLSVHGPLPATRVVRSPSGGEHFYFRLPEGMKSQNIINKLRPGIDIKADGGYVFTEPSPGYTVVTDLPVADAPQWLINYIEQYMKAKDAPEPRLGRGNRVEVDTETEEVKEIAKATADFWLDLIVNSRDGIQNTYIYVAGRVFGSLVAYDLLDEDYAYDLLEQAADEGNHPRHRAIPTIKSGMRAGLRNPDDMDDLLNPDRTVIRAFTWDDFGNAERVAFYTGEDIKYDPERNQFYLWTGSHWAEAAEAEVSSKIMTVLSAMITNESAFYSNEVLETPEDGKKKPLTPRESFRAWAKTQRFSRKVQDCLRALKSRVEIHCSSEEFDQQPYKLNLANGVLDLKTLEMAPHAREFMFTVTLGTAYDEKASADNWERFMKMVMPKREHREYIQRLAGMTMVGEAIEQRFILNVGQGGLGKGVFHEVLDQILGCYSRKADRKAFVGQGSQRTFEMYHWEGKRMVYADEIGSGRLNGEFLKEITGGGTLTVEGKGRDHKEFVPQFTIWLCSNDIPQMSNESAMERRFLLVKWLGKKLTGEQWDTFKDDDNRIVPRFFYNREASGILNWLLKGLKDYLNHGLQIPADWDEEAKALLVEGDMEAQFVRENLEITGNKADTADQKAVYSAYEKFFTESAGAMDRNARLGKIGFNKKLMNELNFVRDDNNGRPRWVGCRLKVGIMGK